MLDHRWVYLFIHFHLVPFSKFAQEVAKPEIEIEDASEILKFIMKVQLSLKIFK